MLENYGQPLKQSGPRTCRMLRLLIIVLLATALVWVYNGPAAAGTTWADDDGAEETVDLDDEDSDDEEDEDDEDENAPPPTPTSTATLTPLPTPTPTNSLTPTSTPTPTPPATPTPTDTPPPTPTPTPTPTDTPTPTPTATPTPSPTPPPPPPTPTPTPTPPHPDKCTLDVDLTFADGIITWDFVVGAPQPSTWSTSVIILGENIPLWFIGLPPLRSITISFSFPIPPIGVVEVQSTLAVTGGQCSASDAVDTGV